MGMLWQVIRKYHLGEDMLASSQGDGSSVPDHCPDTSPPPPLPDSLPSPSPQSASPLPAPLPAPLPLPAPAPAPPPVVRNTFQDIKDRLLHWTQERIKPYGTRMENFTSSLDDGEVFSALVASIDGRFHHWTNMDLSPEERMDRAFKFAEMYLDIPMLVQAADMAGCVDEKSAITYIALFYQLYKDQQIVSVGKDEIPPIDVRVDGDGWEKGKVGIPSTFTITPNKNPLGLPTAMEPSLLKLNVVGPNGEVIPVEVHENDGVFVCSYIPLEIGETKVEVRYGDKLLAENVVQITKPKIDVQIDGNGFKKAQVGEKSSFTVIPTDNESQMRLSPTNLKCIIIGPNGEELPVDCGVNELDGSLCVSYLPTQQGLHNIQLYYGADKIVSRPVIVKPPALHFNIHGPGLHELQAEVPTGYFVTVLDGAKGNVIDSFADLVGRVITPNGDELPVQKVQNEDHSVSFLYTPSVEGLHRILLEFEEVDVLDISVNSLPPPSSKDRHFIVKGQGLHEVIIGERASFVVTMFDKPDGTQLKPDGKLSVTVMDPQGQILTSYIEEAGGDVSKVHYTPLIEGEHTISLYYNTRFIIDAKPTASPPPLNLHFDIKGPGLHGCVVGEETQFFIHVSDKSSGESVSGIDSLSISIVNISDNTPLATTVSEDPVKTIRVSYVAVVSGKYHLNLSYGVHQLLSKEISAAVAKSKASMHFSIKGQGLKSGKVGTKSIISVRILDKVGGSVTLPVGDKLTCVVLDQAKNLVDIHQADAVDGSRDVWYIPTNPGPHSILLKFGEKKLFENTIQISP